MRQGQSLAVLDTSFKDQKVNSFLHSKVDHSNYEADRYTAWIGGYALTSNWTWVNNNTLQDRENLKWEFTTVPKDYQGCAAVEGNATNDEEHSSVVKISSRQCRTQLNFICQKNVSTTNHNAGQNTSDVSECFIGSYKGVQVGHVCYILYGKSLNSAYDPDTFKQSWMKARLSCFSLDAHLAHFDTVSSDTVRSILKDLSCTGSCWVGLTRREWCWTSLDNPGRNSTENAEMTYQHWYSDPPVVYQPMDCVATGAYAGYVYGWTDEKCDDNRPFVCEKRISKLTTPSSEHLNATVTNKEDDDEDDEERFRDWESVIIACAIICLIALAAILSVACYFRQRRKGYTPEP
jgi:hypothetical protein